MPKYAIGVDFGTLSGRAVLVELGTSRELASSVWNYEYGVMDERLPDGTPLPADWALQMPADYLAVLSHAVPAVLREGRVAPRDVIGIGIDFTACTVIAVDRQGRPMCELPQWRGNPHSYVKLWKHHAAQDQANRLNAAAARRGERFLARYGGKISSEWMFPKIWQVLEEAPELYAATDRFMEAADWVVMHMTGRECRNACTAGYKAIFHKGEGYPDPAFFKSLDPRLENVVADKLSCAIYPQGSKAGEITPEMAALTGLAPGTAVAVANVDAHVTVPALGITEPWQMLMIMGTSTCHILVGTREEIVPGMCGVVEDGVLPGYFGFEAGQSCVGDHFQWFAERCVPAAYERAAAERGLDIQAYLTELAGALQPGQSGLVALDWWNGNRSVLVDADLTGLLLGMTLKTKPEEIYRALIEATAYGTRTIIENYRRHNVPVNKLFAAGGIAEKNPVAMQIYADVTGMEIAIAASAQAPAVGSAMFGAVAAGAARGGYDTIFDAARSMGRVRPQTYRPDPQRALVYDRLFAEYSALHEYFGRGGNDVMKRLKAIRRA